MLHRIIAAGLFIAPFFAQPALALNVLTDIRPVHALVGAVVGDTGTAGVLLDRSADPHHLTLRPSDAKAISSADVIIWTSAGLTPWLEETLDEIAPDAVKLELMTLPDTRQQGGDPHGWLDPDNAQLWLGAVAALLSEADPDNRAAYEANADAARDRITLAVADVEASLADVTETPYLVYHDALAHFEHRFGLTPAGAITDTHAHAPNPSHLRTLQTKLAESHAACMFVQAGEDEGLVDAIDTSHGLRRVIIDPLGNDLPLGPDLYPDLLRNLAVTMAGCLSEAAH